MTGTTSTGEDGQTGRRCPSRKFGYLRILELEGVKKRRLVAALDRVSRDFHGLDGVIIDIRNNPGGDDSTAITIVNRFCDRKRIAFHRKTKIGPPESDFTALKTWRIKPQGDLQFTGPIVLLTCDSVFSGGEVFALAMKQLPYVTILGDHTNGIFSYQLEKKLPNRWRYRLSYQKYFSPDMTCYEGVGVPADITLLNSKTDIEEGIDSLIVRALEVLESMNGERTGNRPHGPSFCRECSYGHHPRFPQWGASWGANPTMSSNPASGMA